MPDRIVDLDRLSHCRRASFSFGPGLARCGKRNAQVAI